LLKNGIMFAAVMSLVVAAVPAHAQEPTLSLTVQNGRFQPTELRAPANKAFVISIKNGDAKPVEFESVSLRVEKVIGGKSQGTVRIRALSPGRYEFFDDFNQSNRGAVVVQ
jgi:cupredoxin-like protein